jgi:hypothetical protein
MKMMSKLLGNEEINAAMVVALSGTIIALVAKGEGPVSLKKMVSGVLSNPVPQLEPTGARATSVSFQATHLRSAA